MIEVIGWIAIAAFAAFSGIFFGGWVATLIFKGNGLSDLGPAIVGCALGAIGFLSFALWMSPLTVGWAP